MSTTIDERIVSMKFNNSEFQKRISDTMDSLRKLKDSLNFSGAKTAFADLDRAGKSMNLGGLASSVDQVTSRFSAMSVVGIAALAAIGVKAVQIGGIMAAKLFVDPAKSGLQEYETNLNSIQTILANTSAKGSTLEDVNNALDTLNEYSDKTIYNFSEMARNIGTFTAAGVDLETSTSAIKGIANLAAISGSNSQQASTAMYQLSQALSSGTVKLMDWNSVVNAGMGGEVFQNALKETARVHGVAIDDLIAQNGSFRDSLQEGWLTSEILTETLSKFTGELTDDQLRSMGYTEEQIKGIQKMATGAVDAATKVKTASQLIGTLAEQSGSGWAKTMQLILGDFEEARTLFTDLNNFFGTFVQEGADARNQLLGDWKELGGRDVLLEGLWNILNGIAHILRTVQEAFREVFPPMTGQRLFELTVMFRDLTRIFILNDTQTSILKNVFKALFSVIKVGTTIIGGFLRFLGKLFAVIFSGGDDINILGENIANFFAWISEGLADTAWITDFFSRLGDVVANVVGFLRDGAIAIGMMAASFAGFTVEGAEVAFTRIRERLEQFGKIGEWVIQTWERLQDAFARIAKFFSPITDALGEMFSDIGQNIYDAFADVDFNTVLDLINVGLLGGLVFLIKKFMDGGIWSLFGKGAKEGLVDSLKGITGDFRGILTGVTDTLEVMQQSLRADILMKIAVAIGLLAAAVLVLSLIDSADLTKALTAMTIMFIQLGGAMAVFAKIATGPNIASLPAMAGALILVAIAINILASAVTKLGKLEWDDLIKGLVGVSALLVAIGGAVKIMGNNAGPLIATGLGMIAIAFAIKILASAVADFAELSWGEMAQGLVGVGAVLAGLLLFNRLSAANKGAIVNGVGLILLATALKILASAVSDFATMNIGGLVQGIGAMGVVLGVLAVFMKSTANVGQMISFATGLVILGAAMKIMASAVSDFGAMSVEQLVKGLVGLAGALAIVTLALLAMPANTLVSAAALVVVGAALKIIGSALKDMGGMSWEEIGKGLVVLAGSLIIIAGAMYLMTAALPGAAALLVVALALSMIAPVLKMLGGMSWEEIGRGLVALAGAFGVIGLAGLVLAPLTPILLALGIAIGLIGAGLGLIGAGVFLFALGLTLLAAAGLAAIPVVVALVTGILALIPFAMEQLGLGIVAFAGVIGESAPVFLEAMTALIMTLLEAIQTLAPEITDTLLLLIEELLNGIVEAVPMFVDAGMRLIIGILNGISENIGDLIDAGADVIIEFLQGIEDNIEDVIQQGADTVIAVLNGIAQGIEDNKQDFIDAGSRIFRAVVDGVASAIEQGGADLAWAGGRIGEAIINGAMNALGINSPSKVFRDYIMGAVFEGIEDGGDKGENRARHTGENLGAVMVAGVANTIAGLASAVQTDLDMSPTIRPVLDMSQFRRDAQGMGNVLAAPLIRPTATAEEAIGVRDAIDERTSADAAIVAPTKIVEVKMEQTNISPEPLTTAEIYRRTNNQVNQVKGILEDEDV